MDTEAPLCELLIPFLRSCKQETLKPITGNVTGDIPTWLQGSLLRVGCGLLEIGEDKYNNIFDGMALLHKFTMSRGQVTYENKFLKSDTYRKNMKANKIVVSEFATPARPDPRKAILSRFSSLLNTHDFTDNSLVNIVKYADEYYACSETNYMWKVDPISLESIQKVDLKEFIMVNFASAHPHKGRDGSTYNVGFSLVPKPSYVFYKFPPKDESARSPFAGVSVIGTIRASNSLHPTCFHTFGMTKNYLIFVEHPLEISVANLLYAHFTFSAYSDSVQWHPEKKVKFHVMRKNTGEVLKTTYISQAFLVYHHINAYEDGQHLVVDMCTNKDDAITKAFFVETLKELCEDVETIPMNMFMSRGRRYVLPLNVELKKSVGENLVTLDYSEAKAIRQKDGHVLLEPENLIKNDTWTSEFPRINYQNYNGRKYRYYYAIGATSDSGNLAVIKVDTKDKSVSHWMEKGAFPSEPVFVPHPESTNEDDGILLVSLLSTTDLRYVTFLVLDARDMSELGRAFFRTQSDIPGDCHGIFIPDDQHKKYNS